MIKTDENMLYRVDQARMLVLRDGVLPQRVDLDSGLVLDLECELSAVDGLQYQALAERARLSTILSALWV